MPPYGRDALENHASKRHQCDRRAVAEKIKQQVAGIELPAGDEELVRLVEQGREDADADGRQDARTRPAGPPPPQRERQGDGGAEGEELRRMGPFAHVADGEHRLDGPGSALPCGGCLRGCTRRARSDRIRWPRHDRIAHGCGQRHRVAGALLGEDEDSDEDGGRGGNGDAERDLADNDAHRRLLTAYKTAQPTAQDAIGCDCRAN